jgi:hypothetical protein
LCEGGVHQDPDLEKSRRIFDPLNLEELCRVLLFFRVLKT